ncbi:MAG: ABC transporter permease [Pirellulales bacterium]
MNLFHIVLRNLQFRRLASFLTLLSMALGVTLVILVLTVAGIIRESFQRNTSVGYNLVVGPKGSPLQLTMSSVLFVGQPINSTLPYSYFLEYLPGNGRQKAIEEIGGKIDAPERAGRYAMFINGGFAIPICMGDYIGTFRVVGTTEEYLTTLRYGPANDREFRFAKGRNFEKKSKEHGFFEAVIGSVVAADLKLKIGDVIKPTHGPEGEAHSSGFTVVGILEPTGTPNDRVALINIEGFYLLEGHVAPERDEETGLEKNAESHRTSDGTSTPKTKELKPLPIEQREVTAILVKTSGFGIGIQQQINKSKSAQAVSPVGEITGLLENFFKPTEFALLGLTILVCIVSAISILVGIYNSMNERTHDIAVMRALGASRDRVLAIILGEALLISVGGGILGWAFGHLVSYLASPMVEYRTGIRIGFFDLNSTAEPYIIPGLIVVGILAGLLPAIMAYRTDVSKSLSS